MDKIFLRGLRVDTIIGLYDWERTLKRPLIFDLELAADLRPAGISDAMEDSVDYAAIREIVREVSHTLQPKLLETLGEAVSKALFAAFPTVQTLRLVIDKPGAIPDVKGVGVEMTRQRSDYA